jgi:uncharacterized protein (DUF1697 family)
MSRRFVVLLRGINVGGRNRVPMAELRSCLEQLGFTDVSTYIASGNVLLRSTLALDATRELIEHELPRRFDLDTELIRVHVITDRTLRSIVEHAPSRFGEQPDIYHSDAIFLMGITPAAALKVFSPRDGVDAVWKGSGVIYSQRLSAERAKSRLGKIVGTPAYASMTIRSWQTVMRLVDLLDEPQLG